MNKQEITDIAGAYGWLPINSNNYLMMSFKKETGERMNVYHTTMTVTVQYPSGRKAGSYRRVITPLEFEKIAERGT